ncbi:MULTISPECIES: LD-carboxypeptidase [unclassified Mucilaginibacter]|uniref:S66 peptidase family protein n=1 Tax=unclassified Mucilaginibacter TaxID=2617802 RepID=UPI002AC9E43B|nr:MULTISPECIES: LD-carboxypeptidase [unclassified Mucilaginibacter]MEB0263791.1 LD-carboxypeptidase [Mucilaginibacter sp. 10I4]MEB0278249.1 LD-carboxypeptidase [Mucilaginibacter sp. 10B2]MEB0300965.1 LD-carboxypeptidase [Mucilaginibacter sp. 5C4]WPX23895.1 LD-carboxypeptidase [Mucilaginibacter sp. 5C4]
MPTNELSDSSITHLKKGDKVAITCPAKKLPIPMTDAVNLLESWGLEVVLGDTVNASYHQFAGDDAFRAADMQRFIDDDSIKAIFCARGGYGAIRMVDLVDFSHMATNPKWMVGFSDITLLHSHIISNYNLPCIHGQMPLTIPDASAHSLETLRQALFGEELIYRIAPNHLNRLGTNSGILIGGNLSLLLAVINSVSDMDYSGKILFIEDVGEYLYAVDRMLRALKRAGKLKNLSGLIVGSFTSLKDNDIPFGQTLPQIIMEAVAEYDYPVCFDFPAGHVSNNCSLVLGRALNLSVKTEGVEISYL